MKLVAPQPQRGDPSPGKHRGHRPQPRCSWTPGCSLDVRTSPSLSSVTQTRDRCFGHRDCPVGPVHTSVPSPVLGTVEREPQALSKPLCLLNQRPCRREIAERGVSDASGLVPGIWSSCPWWELRSACGVQGCRACAAFLFAGNIHSAQREKPWHIQTTLTDVGPNT